MSNPCLTCPLGYKCQPYGLDEYESERCDVLLENMTNELYNAYRKFWNVYVSNDDNEELRGIQKNLRRGGLI